MKRKKIIIIHWARPLYSKNKYLQKIITIIYKYVFNFSPQYYRKNQRKKTFPENQYEIIEILRSGKVNSCDLKKASKILQEILKKDIHHKYTILTESLWAEIAFLGIEKTKNLNIKNIFCLCPVNKPRSINDIRIFMLKWNKDIFEKIANKILRPLHIFKEMQWNIKEIIIENAKHEDFLPHYIHKNKTLFQWIEEKIN